MIVSEWPDHCLVDVSAPALRLATAIILIIALCTDSRVVVIHYPNEAARSNTAACTWRPSVDRSYACLPDCLLAAQQQEQHWTANPLFRSCCVAV